MPSLQPCRQVALGAIERLVLTIRGPVADSYEIGVADPATLTVQDLGRGRYVINAVKGCSQQIVLHGRGNSPMTGSVIVEVRVIGGTGQSLDVTDINLLGDAETRILLLSIDTEGDADLVNIFDADFVLGDNGGHWVARKPTRTSAVCLIDRSASMAWAYLQRLLPAVLAGIAEGFENVITDTVPELFTYGAATEGIHCLQAARSLPGEHRFHVQAPDLFSSGSRVPQGALVDRGDDLTVVITDAPRPLGQVPGSVGFILPISGDAAGLTQDMQDALAACEHAGQPVLVLRAQSNDQVRLATAEWISAWLRSALTRRRESH